MLPTRISGGFTGDEDTSVLDGSSDDSDGYDYNVGSGGDSSTLDADEPTEIDVDDSDGGDSILNGGGLTGDSDTNIIDSVTRSTDFDEDTDLSDATDSSGDDYESGGSPTASYGGTSPEDPTDNPVEDSDYSGPSLTGGDGGITGDPDTNVLDDGITGDEDTNVTDPDGDGSWSIFGTEVGISDDWSTTDDALGEDTTLQDATGEVIDNSADAAQDGADWLGDVRDWGVLGDLGRNIEYVVYAVLALAVTYIVGQAVNFNVGGSGA